MSLQRKLSRLFCQHMYQTINSEYLRTERERYGIKWGMTAYANFIYYAETQRCIKCRKEKIVERKYVE